MVYRTRWIKIGGKVLDQVLEREASCYLPNGEEACAAPMLSPVQMTALFDMLEEREPEYESPVVDAQFGKTYDGAGLGSGGVTSTDELQLDGTRGMDKEAGEVRSVSGVVASGDTGKLEAGKRYIPLLTEAQRDALYCKLGFLL